MKNSDGGKMFMYIHAGNSRTVRTRDVVGIFDMDRATMAPATREYLRAAERGGSLINVKEDIPKSFIVVKPQKKRTAAKNKPDIINFRDTVYVSQISPSALVGRAGLNEREKNPERKQNG